MLNRYCFPLAVLVGLALTVVTPFRSVSADNVNDRLTTLENSVKDFQQDSVARNEKVASALSTIEQVKQDYLSTVGNIEANNHMMLQLQIEMDRLKRDMTDRISALEEKLDLYDMQISKAVAKLSPGSANETEVYQKALDSVHKGDYLSAAASFRAFLKGHPKSDLADNAQYWIGECYYAMRDYQKAIKEFQALLDKFPRSGKAPGALLKQGYSFAELKMPDEAKMFLNKVIKDYPSSEEAVRAKEKIDRLSQKTAESAQQAAPASKVQDATSNIPLAPGLKNQPKPAVPATPPASRGPREGN
jgi:tol-pal system protein YbgF